MDAIATQLALGRLQHELGRLFGELEQEGAEHEPAQRQGRRGAVMLAEEPVAALVEVDVTAEQVLAAAGRLMVHNLGPWDEPDLIARLPQPVAEVHLLRVHEEALVEAADLIQSGATEQQARAHQPVALLRDVVRLGRAVEAAERAEATEPALQDGALDERRP